MPYTCPSPGTLQPNWLIFATTAAVCPFPGLLIKLFQQSHCAAIITGPGSECFSTPHFEALARSNYLHMLVSSNKFINSCNSFEIGFWNEKEQHEVKQTVALKREEEFKIGVCHSLWTWFPARVQPATCIFNSWGSLAVHQDFNSTVQFPSTS